MWPWGHLAVGYLCYVAWARHRRVPQQPLAVVAVAVGSQFPDLVDKPLAWTVAVLPSGRSLAHSLFTAAIVLALVARLGRRYGRRAVSTAFAIGYLTHTLGDLGPRVIGGLLVADATQLRWTTYLVWPLLPAPPYPNDSSLVEHLLAFSLDPFVAAQFGLFGLACVVWVWTGAPGYREALALLKRSHNRHR